MKIVPFSSGFAEDTWRLTNLHRLTPVSLREYLERDARWPVHDFRRRWLGLEGQRAKTFGQIAYSPYVPHDHVGVTLIVDVDSRGDGKGSAMLALLEAESRASGFRVLSATVSEAALETRQWAQARGFFGYAQRYDCVLDLQAFDRPKRELPGITFSDMTNASDGDWRRAAELLQTLVADAPDMQGLPSWDMGRCLSIIRDAPIARPEWVIIATREGEAIGLTIGHAMGNGIYSYFTGVIPSWRGRGLAGELKVRLIRGARRLGVSTMRATNLDTNVPALRLNDALGFRRIPGSVELRKPLALA